MRLGRTDFEAILDFLADVDDIGFDEPYPSELLARLASLLPCDEVAYQDFDLPAHQFRSFVAFAPGVEEHEDDEARYWAVAPCPITEYRLRTHDLSAVRMSDVISRQRYHELAIYRDYFHPARLDQLMDLGLSADPRHHRSVVLFRGPDAADFSERELAVLETLRPYFRAREARAELRRRLAATSWKHDDGVDENDVPLTPREREIVWLVAEGRTNAQIAAELWVAPGTVKKHLENVYSKLGVSRRAAVASRLQPHL